MTKSKYDQERDERVKQIQEHFSPIGIPILAQEVSGAFAKKKKGLQKIVVSSKPDSDIEYDPTSDIDNHSDSDNDSDDLNNDGVTNEVRCITWPINTFSSCLFQTCTSLYSSILPHTSILYNL